MGRQKGRERSDQVESLLQRLKRQSSEVALPPNEASTALGRHLGASLVQVQHQDLEAVGGQILEELASLHVNPSVPHAYFDLLSSSDASEVDATLLYCLPRWICRCDQILLQHQGGNACNETLTSAIRAFALISHRCITKNQTVDDRLVDMFYRLQLPISRTCVIRSFVGLARKRFSDVRVFLSPLMAATVLSMTSAFEEKSLFLEGIWREYWMLLRSPKILSVEMVQVIEFLSWMKTSLHLFLKGISGDREVMSMEMAYNWLVQLVDAICIVLQNVAEETDSFGGSLSGIVETIIRDTLPYFYAGSSRIPLRVVLDQVLTVIETGEILKPPSDSVALFRLTTLGLSTPNREDISGIMSLLATCRRSTSRLLRGMMHALTCIYGNDGVCHDAALRLHQASTTLAAEEQVHNGRVTNILFLFAKHPTEVHDLLQTITLAMTEPASIELCATQQNAALLLGVGLLGIPLELRSLADTYLKQLLQQFPHLGITFLPVITESIQKFSQLQEGDAVLHWLEFLCGAVVHDPHCAQEVWNIVGVKLGGENTSVLRSCVIRLYPRLCCSNKKLYRRVIDALGVAASSSSAEVRLAVAATIAELAAEDRIRDVSDVIGWTQTFLADENSSVVHYAIMTLHHLVVAQELDFNVVIKVLNKRLRPVTDLQEILKLPPVCLEALALLLGDGECDEGDSSDDGGAKNDGDTVSPQVTGAVNVLIQLERSPAMSPISGESLYSKQEVARIRQNIYKSLSRYSLNALGVDEDGVRAATTDEEADQEKLMSEAGARYQTLTDVALHGIEFPEDGSQLQDTSDFVSPAVALVRTLIEYEEEVLGPSLWKKGTSRKVHSEAKAKSRKAQKSAIAALPSPDVVLTLYSENPSTVTAIASLMCFEVEAGVEESENYGRVLVALSDIANDISNDSSDPMLLALVIQGWLHAMGNLWSAIALTKASHLSDSLRDVVAEIQGWCGTLEEPDQAYLALACLCIFIPDSYIHVVDEIYRELMDAFRGHSYGSRDVAHICLGLAGAQASNCRMWKRMSDSIELLEQFAQSSSVQGSFGTHYGLAMIAQVLPGAQKSAGGVSLGDLPSASSVVGKIAGLLVEDLVSCLESTSAPLINLVACLKSGNAPPDLVQSMSRVEESSLFIHDSTKRTVQSTCLSLALCLPSLQTLGAEFLLALYRLIEGLPWGCGKGLALPSSIMACFSARLLHQGDVDNAVQQWSHSLDLAMERNEEATVGDIFYALSILSRLNVESAKSIGSAVSHQFVRGSPSLSSIMAAAVTVGTVPCFGSGAPFYYPCQLDPLATEDTVSKAVGIVTAMVNGSNGIKSRESSTLALGLLSSMKGSSDTTAVLPFSTRSPKAAASHTAIADSTQSGKIKLSSLPAGRSGSMLHEILGLIQQCCDIMHLPACGTENGNQRNLPIVLSCLETISIPGQFASNFIEPILNDDAKGSADIKTATTELLVSQTIGRRRAAFDGRDFVNFSFRISMLPASSFVSLLGDKEGPQEFLSSLPQMIPKFPTASIAAVIENAWQICMDGSTLTRATMFLSSIRVFLRSATSSAQKGKIQVSPKTISTVRRFALQDVFAGIYELGVVTGKTKNGANTGVLLETYSKCLSEIPLSFLDENDFFKFDFEASDSILRIAVAMILVRLEYFNESGRSSREVSKAVAWFLRQNVSTMGSESHPDAPRHVAFDIALAAQGETTASRKDILLMVLESMVLVKGTSRTLCLQFLAALLAGWVKDGGSNAEISLAVLFVHPNQSLSGSFCRLAPSVLLSISDMLVFDLPWNLGAYCRAERASATIINRVWSIRNAWSDGSSDPDDIGTLQKILTCCRGDEANEQQYSSLAVTMLI